MRHIIVTILALFCIFSTVYGDNTCERTNTLIEAIETPVSKDLIRAIAWVESSWNHTTRDGKPFQHINTNGSSDWGVMQINDATLYHGWDLARVKTDMEYNILVGVRILEWKLKDAARLREKYNITDKTTLQLGIQCYNGYRHRKNFKFTYLQKVEKVLKEKPWLKHLKGESIMFIIPERNKSLLYSVYHHSYSQDLDTVLDTFGVIDYHIKVKKWKREGYNELTETLNGRPLTIAGRPMFMRGAHTIGMNHNSYGSCLIGNYDKEKPSKEVWNHLIERALVTMITYKIPIQNFIGHWESFLILGKVRTKKDAWKKYKTCPGTKFDMDQFRNDLYYYYQKYMKKVK